MPRYNVKVREREIRSVNVEVEAEDESAAVDAALAEVGSWSGDRWLDESEVDDVLREPVDVEVLDD